ncbi:MAG: hypothetical protein FWG45_00265 [Oscillospiraceae bacterium]|nr:hypothetical protein [Oscillospiraceae bacterium]
MKNTETKRKTIAGIVSGAIVLIAVVTIANLVPENQANPIAENEPQIEQIEQTEVTTTLESEPSETPATTRRSVTTRNVPSTAATAADSNSDDELPVVEVTLAPVEVPDKRVAEILEERDVQVAEKPAAARTTPPPTKQETPDGVQYGDIVRNENGQRYVWDPIIGIWILENGAGTVTIMDVQSDGHKFYTDSEGRVRLDKVVTPSGDVITYEEYEAWRNSR